MKKYIKKIIFIIICIAQITLITYTIINARKILENKKLIRLKCILYDPYDFMKGRYVQLNLDIQRLPVKNYEELKWMDENQRDIMKGQEIYLIMEKTDDHYKVSDIKLDMPFREELFIKVKVKSMSKSTIYLDIDFDQYFMQEEYAIAAEKILWGADRRNLNLILILSSDDKGNVVQKGMELDGIPIEKYIEKKLKEEKKK